MNDKLRDFYIAKNELCLQFYKAIRRTEKETGYSFSTTELIATYADIISGYAMLQVKEDLKEEDEIIVGNTVEIRRDWIDWKKGEMATIVRIYWAKSDPSNKICELTPLDGAEKLNNSLYLNQVKLAE